MSGDWKLPSDVKKHIQALVGQPDTKTMKIKKLCDKLNKLPTGKWAGAPDRETFKAAVKAFTRHLFKQVSSPSRRRSGSLSTVPKRVDRLKEVLTDLKHTTVVPYSVVAPKKFRGDLKLRLRRYVPSHSGPAIPRIAKPKSDSGGSAGSGGKANTHPSRSKKRSRAASNAAPEPAAAPARPPPPPPPGVAVVPAAARGPSPPMPADPGPMNPAVPPVLAPPPPPSSLDKPGYEPHVFTSGTGEALESAIEESLRVLLAPPPTPTMKNLPPSTYPIDPDQIERRFTTVEERSVSWRGALTKKRDAEDHKASDPEMFLVRYFYAALSFMVHAYRDASPSAHEEFAFAVTMFAYLIQANERRLTDAKTCPHRTMACLSALCAAACCFLSTQLRLDSLTSFCKQSIKTMDQSSSTFTDKAASCLFAIDGFKHWETAVKYHSPSTMAPLPAVLPTTTTRYSGTAGAPPSSWRILWTYLLKYSPEAPTLQPSATTSGAVPFRRKDDGK